MNSVRPTMSACWSFTRTANGSRFSRNALNARLSCSPDFVIGTRLPANSMYCGLSSSTSTSRLLATSVKCSWCSRVLSSRSSVMQKTRSRASNGSVRLAKTTNLAINGTCMASLLGRKGRKDLNSAGRGMCVCVFELAETYLYSSVAILVASAMFRQSISQNRAETVVVNDTQSLTKVSGVEPVTSSHCARVVPPRERGRSIRLSVTWEWSFDLCLT